MAAASSMRTPSSAILGCPGRCLCRPDSLGEPTLAGRAASNCIENLAIEGNTLSIGQVTAVLQGRRVVALPREVQEVRNAHEAYEQMGRWRPEREIDLLAAHGVMMAGLQPEAGRWRSGDVGVGAGGEVIHVAPPAWIDRELAQDRLLS